jgi:hypothetical protein
MPFNKPGLHPFHDAAYLLGVFLGEEPEPVGVFGCIKNVGFKFNRTGTKDHRLTCLFIPLVNELRVLNYYPWHTLVSDSAGLMPVLRLIKLSGLKVGLFFKNYT